MRISEEIFQRMICIINKDEKSNIMSTSFDQKYSSLSISPKRYTFQNLKEVSEFTLNYKSRNIFMEPKVLE